MTFQETEETYIDKDKSKANRRRTDVAKAKQRKKRLMDINEFARDDIAKLPLNIFSNNNIANELGQGGTAIKTNTRKGHASHRHKGAYGKADNYNRHDQRQIDQCRQGIDWSEKDETD